MSEVISKQQQLLNSELHKTNDKFGKRSAGAGLATNLPQAITRMNEMGVCESFLDYGTGKGLLIEHLKSKVKNNVSIIGYDPAVKQYSDKPSTSSDILTCLDVLEHVEISSIDAVMQDIRSLTNNFCYIVIDLQPAVKTLSDGRNAHILLAPSEWWISKFTQYFTSIATFPIYHTCGLEQKLVITATNNHSMTRYMYMFLMKMNVFTLDLRGGTLAKVKI